MAYKQKGWSAFTKKDDKKKKKEYEPQTAYRGYKGSEHTDLTPQTERQKMDSDYLEGHIEGKFDNEYREALDSGDKTRIAREEGQMLKYKKELDNRGVKYDHVDMTNFGKKKKKKSALKLYNVPGQPSHELAMMKHEQNQRLKARDEENKDELLEETRGHYIKKAERKEKKATKRTKQGRHRSAARKTRKAARLRKHAAELTADEVVARRDMLRSV